ncbi:MAG TPA: NAD(P)H-dependent glycerol-3-phosphate dehydrogenase [Verrucomicrobiae bacterium]
MKITVLGAGAWGTALARLLHQAEGADVTLWGHNPQHLQDLKTTRINTRYLPGVKLPTGLKLETDLAKAVKGSECLVVALPSKAFRTVTKRLADYSGLVVSVTKGIEYDTGLTMCGILEQTMPKGVHVTLSGPSIAHEVARNIPSAVVVASPDKKAAKKVQQLFHRPYFRVYSSNDMLGVELGGALKNVIAIAAGVCDGLGFGDNSKAALITRSIVEISRLGVACGAQAETFAGLSGLGDLTVTCFSKHSRNRTFGERLGKGEEISQILFTGVHVAEGYPTACSAHQLAQKKGIEAPLINEIYAMLYEGKNPGKAVEDLLSRDYKAED